MWRPVAYYYQCPTKVGGSCTTAAEILGMGHPLIFWTAVVTIPYAAFAWARKRDWRAGLIVVAFAAQYLPWFLTTRTSFIFYMAPITPFMALAFTYAVRDLAAVPVGVQGRALAPLSAAAVLLAVALFVFFWPILIGQTISWQAWHIRMWFPSWV
jgi:dolichyl-phosphate-mannose--protein O-mannosyl transferase